MKKVIIGIDADLTKIGMSVIGYNSGTLLKTYKFKPDNNLKHFDRTYNLVDKIISELKILKNNYKISYIVIEDYGVLFVQRLQAFKGELVGILKYEIRNLGLKLFRYIDVKKQKKRNFEVELMIAPTKLKKFQFGTGRISKSGKSSELLLRLYKETGIENVTDDEADSYYLALMVMMILKLKRKGITKYNDDLELRVNNGNKLYCTKLIKGRFDAIFDIIKKLE